jgi:TPR repeat protein
MIRTVTVGPASRRGRHMTAGLLLALLVSSGCHRGNSAFTKDASPPAASSPVTATTTDAGRTTLDPCRVAGSRQPLLTRWSAAERDELATAMQSGIAVLAANDCRGLRLLAGCRARGRYGYLGALPSSREVGLVTDEELRINAPRGDTLKNDAGGEPIRVSLTIVGLRGTTRDLLSAGELAGECAGATHFVRKVEIGTAVTVPGARGEATSVEDASRLKADAGPCKQASFDDPSPRAGCGSILDVTINPIADPGTLITFDKAPDDAVLPIGMCPDTMVVSGERCVRPPVATPFLCAFGDAEGCRQQCERGDMNSCDVFGFMLWHGKGVRQDLARAAHTYLRACDAGDSVACSNLAAFHFNGDGVTKDPTKATELFERACHLGDVVSCGNFGLSLVNGAGTVADVARGMLLIERACGAGSADACNQLALRLRTGKAGKSDPARALAILEESCDGNNGSSCMELGRMNILGDGVPADHARAAQQFTRACRAGSDDACVMLGLQYRQADGVERDDVLATRLMGQACSHGAPDGCLNLGIAYEHGKGINPDPARAAALYEQACSGKVGRACLYFADFLSDGTGVAKDTTRARQYYGQACSLGQADACPRAH